ERARALAVLAGDKADPAGSGAFRARLDAVKRAVYGCGDPWAAELAKVLGEPPPPSATRHLGEAVARYKARRYKEALAAADAGLGIGKAGPVAVDLQYIRVASLMSLERWRDGHLAAAEFLRMAPKDPRSPDVCRRALDAGLKALKADPPLELDAFDRFLTFAQTAFADVAEVRDAPWIRASQFLEAGRYREAERVLRDIAPSSPLYLRAQYGLALAAYRQAEGLLEGDTPDPAAAAVHLGRAVAATRRFIDATPTRVPESDQPVAEQVAAIAMAAGQRLLGLPNADPAAAEALINRLDGWRVLGNPADRPHDALRLALALRSGRIDLALEQANDFMNRARPRDARVVGTLLGAADPFESQSARLCREGLPAEAARIDATLRRTYEFLLARAGKADDAALRDQVVTIRRRLGHVLVRLGRPGDAAVHYEWVLANSPREKAGDVLRGLALARETLRQYDKAIESWEVLAQGLKAEADGWFEARYHLVVCHWEAGRWDHARRLMAYFRLRHPEGAPGRWKKEFETLHEKMEKAAGGKPLAEPLGP
ncbi:MAG: tetratricopeptide repeat protein, partial [Planctomycetes bacterium]|nr:tetratricopeptide repeat protein [Planctomycetota bacterium]